MSSTISTVELKSLPPKAIANHKMEEKEHKLVRTYSIEKIRRFNSFICSQHYYILPAILNWLRSSQSGLQSSTEKTIFFFRSLIFSSFLYKMFVLGFNSSGTWSIQTFLRNVRVTTACIISNFYQKFSKCFESTFLLTSAVYVACVIVLLQLFVALYLISFALIPYGFMFLMGCMTTIKYLCYKTFSYAIVNRQKRDIKIKYK